MNENEAKTATYWQIDAAIGRAAINRQKHTIRARFHYQEEQYSGYEELVPMSYDPEQPTPRIYARAAPYIHAPEMTRAVSASCQFHGRSVAHTLDSGAGMVQQRDIGHAQAWFYPKEQILILRECHLFPPYRQVDPRIDEALATFWGGFECLLLQQFPEARRVVTRPWEDAYDRSLWQEFLRAQGYRTSTQGTFAKDLGRESSRRTIAPPVVA